MDKDTKEFWTTVCMFVVVMSAITYLVVSELRGKRPIVEKIPKSEFAIIQRRIR